MKPRNRRVTVICSAAALLATGGSAIASSSHSPTTYTGPSATDGIPLNIAAGPGDSMWFTYASGGASLMSVDPAGAFTDRSALLPASARPYDLAMGPDGDLWVTENAADRVARITPAGAVADPGVALPAGSHPTGITAGPDGNMWVTLAGAPAGIARITTAGTVTVFRTGVLPVGEPADITAGADGNLWFTYGTLPMTGRITPTGEVTTYAAGLTTLGTGQQVAASPDGTVWATFTKGLASFKANGNIAVMRDSAISSAFGLTSGGDGNMWFGDRAIRQLFGVKPSSHHIEDFADLGKGASPAGMTHDGQGNVWAVGGGYPAVVWRYGLAAPVLADVSATPSTTPGAGTATVGFRLNSNGQDTSYVVQFGIGDTFSRVRSGQMDGASSAARSVTVPLTGLRAGSTYTLRVVAGNDAGSVKSANITFTTPAAPTSGGGTGGTPPTTTPGGGTGGSKGDDDTTTPRLGQSVVMNPVQGHVKVRLPGASEDVPLDVAGRLPVGTTVDATDGVVKVHTAVAGKPAQTATFWGARFKLRQDAAGKGMTDLVMDTSPVPGCPVIHVYNGPPELTPIVTLGPTATVTAAKRKKPHRVLWGSDHNGRFRTFGRDSVATVRGTRWATVMTCTGTITRVVKGAVSVRNRRTGRTVLVRAGHSYFARKGN